VRVLALAAAAALALAAPAHALPILAEGDARDLDEQLREAGTAMGVCFGWSVQVVDLGGSASGLDAGGATTGCERELRLVGEVTYTSESSEAEDSASLGVQAAGFPGATADGLGALTGRGAGDLTGDDDDKALFELAAALPLYAAELDPSLSARLPQVERGAPAPGAQVGSAGSDWVRQHGLKAGLGIGLLLGAAFLILTARRPKGTT
jgi:hypothetical protein